MKNNQMNDREKADRQLKTAMELLWNKPVKSTLVERWFLLDNACKKYENEPQPIAMGKGLKEILNAASLPIDASDLLLGRYVDRVPTEEEEKKLADIWQRRVYIKNPITHPNQGHLTLDWETLVKEGLPEYLHKAEHRLTLAKQNGEPEKTVQFLEGMTLVYDAILNYIRRYGKEAEKEGYQDMADVCRNITVRAPSTFREAMQLVLFVFTVYMIYAGWRVACLTLGKMDEYLLPFYEHDLENGMTDGEIRCIIDDFQCKTGLHLGRGEHQMSAKAFEPTLGNTTGWNRNPVFDSPTYIVIGGKETALTKLFVRSITPGMKNPVYIYRRSNHASEEVWNTVCDKLRKNASILVYNDETMIPAMRAIGVEEEDAVRYSIHPCNWPDITGGSVDIGKIGDPIPTMLCQVLYREDGSPMEYSSMEEIYSAYASYYRKLLQDGLRKIREDFEARRERTESTLNLNDCFLPGPLESGMSSKDGGVKYREVYVFLRNIGTAADMMASVEKLVFHSKICTLKELLNACRNQFEGRGDLLAAARRAPKFGTDNEDADRHAVLLMVTMRDLIDEVFSESAKNGFQVYPLCVTITDMDHIIHGKNLPATPDGRLAGEPISENLSPTVGYYESATALLNSVSKLPFDRIHSGALNLRLHTGLVSGEDGLNRLKSLLDVYFKNGGMQVQLSVVDTETLKKAQKNPDEFRDLRVRITGYSAVFVDMTKNGQDEIIRRDEIH